MAEEFKAEAHQLPAGTVLHERFEIKRVIGEGGFGITYEGTDLRLNARVAVKDVVSECGSLDALPRFYVLAVVDRAEGDYAGCLNRCVKLGLRHDLALSGEALGLGGLLNSRVF